MNLASSLASHMNVDLFDESFLYDKENGLFFKIRRAAIHNSTASLAGVLTALACPVLQFVEY